MPQTCNITQAITSGNKFLTDRNICIFFFYLITHGMMKKIKLIQKRREINV